MLYVRVNCFVVRICAVSRRYINVFNSDVISVVNMYLNHLKFCVVCICEVVLIPYVDAVVAVSAMCVLLFLLDMCMLKECEGATLTAMLVLVTGDVWL